MLDLKNVAAEFPDMARFPDGGGWLFADTAGCYWLQERRTAAVVWLTPVIAAGDTMRAVGDTRRCRLGAYIHGGSAYEAVHLTDYHPGDRRTFGAYVRATGLLTVSPMAVAS